jgi:hypothetical protein
LTTKIGFWQNKPNLRDRTVEVVSALLNEHVDTTTSRGATDVTLCVLLARKAHGRSLHWMT